MSNQPPLNPDALEAAAAAARIDWSGRTDWDGAPNSVQIAYRNLARAAVSAYLAAALPEVTSVEELKALPIGSVILDGGGDAGIIEPGAILFAETNPLSPEYVAKHYLPARVLYRPSEHP